MRLVVVLLIPLCFVALGFADLLPPRQVAEAALTAWEQRDAPALERISHPELLAKLRHARIAEHFAQSSPERQEILKSGSDRAVVALVCEALRDIVPPADPRLERVERFVGVREKGGLAVVSFETGWRRRDDPDDERVSVARIVLKKSGDEWRFLWSGSVSIHVDLGWNPEKEAR